MFNIGYNLPTKYFVKQKDNMFALNLTFGSPFKEIIAEEMIVKVILPAGSSGIQHFLPFDVENSSFSEVYSFLDFTGKPVLVLEKKNAMDFHRKPFQVLYTVDPTTIIIKPLILAVYVFVALLFLIISFRLEFNLEKEVKIKTE